MQAKNVIFIENLFLVLNFMHIISNDVIPSFIWQALRWKMWFLIGYVAFNRKKEAVLLNKAEGFKNKFNIVNIYFVKSYSMSKMCHCLTALQIYKLNFIHKWIHSDIFPQVFKGLLWTLASL